jgi:hypothetical protein
MTPGCRDSMPNGRRVQFRHAHRGAAGKPRPCVSLAVVLERAPLWYNSGVRRALGKESGERWSALGGPGPLQ